MDNLEENERVYQSYTWNEFERKYIRHEGKFKGFTYDDSGDFNSKKNQVSLLDYRTLDNSLIFRNCIKAFNDLPYACTWGSCSGHVIESITVSKDELSLLNKKLDFNITKTYVKKRNEHFVNGLIKFFDLSYECQIKGDKSLFNFPYLMLYFDKSSNESRILLESLHNNPLFRTRIESDYVVIGIEYKVPYECLIDSKIIPSLNNKINKFWQELTQVAKNCKASILNINAN